MNEFSRLIRAAGFSAAGLASAWKGEAAFRTEVILFVVAIPLAIWIAPDVSGIIPLLGVLVLLMVVELLNSAVEAAIDRIGPERHELSKAAKDYGSAAVMLTSLLCAAVWANALWLRLA